MVTYGCLWLYICNYARKYIYPVVYMYLCLVNTTATCVTLLSEFRQLECLRVIPFARMGKRPQFKVSFGVLFPGKVFARYKMVAGVSQMVTVTTEITSVAK